MTRRRRRKSRGEQLRGAALRALRGDARTSSDTRALTGARAVATGAVLYAAVRAVFAGAQRASTPAAADESNTTRRQPSDDRSQPSLALPNQRWPRIAADRR